MRGFQPWPNAYTHHDGSRIVIWQAAARVSANQLAAAGEVVKSAGDNLVLKCGEQTELHLLEIQPEAKRRMSVRDYLNGAQLAPGARFQ